MWLWTILLLLLLFMLLFSLIGNYLFIFLVFHIISTICLLARHKLYRFLFLLYLRGCCFWSRNNFRLLLLLFCRKISWLRIFSFIKILGFLMWFFNFLCYLLRVIDASFFSYKCISIIIILFS
jgi:hypothetical protein